MSLLEGLGQFATELEKAGVKFGIIGGLAVYAYGGERTTFDVDFLIHGQDRSAVKEIAEKLKLKTLNENTEVLQLSGTIQVDIVFANRPTSQMMLNCLRRLKTLPFPVVAPEDLVGLKIQAFVGDRSREYTDKADILTIFRNVSDLDFKKIKEYADIFQVWNEIEEIKKRV